MMNMFVRFKFPTDVFLHRCPMRACVPSIVVAGPIEVFKLAVWFVRSSFVESVRAFTGAEPMLMLGSFTRLPIKIASAVITLVFHAFIRLQSVGKVKCDS